MELFKLKSAVFGTFCLLSSLVVVFIFCWNDPEWGQYRMVVKLWSSNYSLGEKLTHSLDHTDRLDKDSFIYYAPGAELRKKSDELKDLTPEQFYAKLNKSLQDAQKEKFTIIYIHRNSLGTKRVSTTPYHCGNCEVVFTMDKVNDSTTKALVFHFRSADKKNFPTHRRPDQYYVWQSRESIAHAQRYAPLEFPGNFFNLTMSQRRFRDVFNPYQTSAELYTAKNLPKNDSELDSIIANKSKFALWVVSNCGQSSKSLNGSGRRMNYAKKLIKLGLNIELGGKCFRNKQKDFENRKFKFYFAFENSWNCSDYITEKFWRNSLLYDAVPVVLGAPKRDYLETAPPNSFIYAQDFDSPKKLAAYLKYLDGNATAYKEYFHWMKLKLEEMPYVHRTESFCQLCRLLHGINIDNLYNTKYETEYKDIPMFGFPSYPRMIPSLKEHLFNTEQNGCLDFPI